MKHKKEDTEEVTPTWDEIDEKIASASAQEEKTEDPQLKAAQEDQLARAKFAESLAKKGLPQRPYEEPTART